MLLDNLLLMWSSEGINGFSKVSRTVILVRMRLGDISERVSHPIFQHVHQVSANCQVKRSILC